MVAHNSIDEEKNIDVVLEELNKNDVSKYEENQNEINIRLKDKH